MNTTAERVVSLASKSIPDLLTTIFKCATMVRTVIRRAKFNIHRLQRLSERIEMVAVILQGRKLKETTDQSMKLALAYFIVFLEECIEFMEKFSDTGFVKRLWNNKNYSEKLEDLHETFTHRVEAIKLSETLTTVLINDNKDEHDQQSDYNHMQQLLEIQDTKANDCDSSLETIEQLTDDKQSKSKNQKENIFVTGVWKYQRSLDETWSDPLYLEFSSFDLKKKTLRGFGEDHKGHFRLNGTLCPKTQTMKITWLYRDKESNDNCQLRLKWDSNRNVFFNIVDQKSADLSIGQFEMTLYTPLLED